MNWFIFALLAALFVSASALVEKKALKTVHSIDLSSTLAFSNLIFALPFLFFVDFSKVEFHSMVVIFGSGLVAAIAFYLVAKAIRHMEISTVAPLLALTPGTTSFFGFFILGERLDPQSIWGIVFMIIGSYILTLEPGKGIFSPIKMFAESKYIHFVLASLLFYSMGATLDRAILFDFEVPIANYMFFVHLFIGLLYVPALFFIGRGLGGIVQALKTEKKNIFFISAFTIIYRFFQMQALSLMFVGLVSAIKRSSSFFTTLIGGELFHEKHLGRKMLASLVIILGTVLIVL